MALKKLLSTCFPLVIMTANASTTATLDENFMLVLRESKGANKQIFGFDPVGPATATLDSGETIEMNNAWFDLIGDMHVRFVIDGENSMENLTADEFAALGLSVEKAADIAMKNIKARYGEPHVEPFEDGIMLVSGASPDLDSSYFLDRPFWDALLSKHPAGLVVGVPKRGGLI